MDYLAPYLQHDFLWKKAIDGLELKRWKSAASVRGRFRNGRTRIAALGEAIAGNVSRSVHARTLGGQSVMRKFREYFL